MSEPLADWPRKYYQPDAGDALIFFVVFGKFGEIGPVSQSSYRCAAIPETVDMQEYKTEVHLQVLNSFREGLLWDLEKEKLGTLREKIEQAPECIVIRGEIPDPSSLNYLRDVVGLSTYLLDHGGCAIYDPQRLKYWSPSEWHSMIFEPGHAVPLAHSIILVSEEANKTKWFHTRGLRKFGRADLSVHRVPADADTAVHELINRFIVFQAEGGVITEGQEIKMKSLPSGLRCHITGDLDDPDFNNIHVEIGVRDSDGPFGF